MIPARVPAWCAPWATEQTHTPDPSDQAWDKRLYVETPTPWPTFPKPQGREMLGVLGRCPQGFRARFTKPPTTNSATSCRARRAGCSVHEANDAVVLGAMVFNSAQVRRLATIGAEMYAPVKDDGKRPWRFVVDDLYMDGLVLPIATEAEYFKKDNG